jgi:hypothetical protein
MGVEQKLSDTAYVYVISSSAKHMGDKASFTTAMSPEVTARVPSRNGAICFLHETERVEGFVLCRIRLLSVLPLLIQWHAERGSSSSSKSDVRLWKHA